MEKDRGGAEEEKGDASVRIALRAAPNPHAAAEEVQELERLDVVDHARRITKTGWAVQDAHVPRVQVVTKYEHSRRERQADAGQAECPCKQRLPGSRRAASTLCTASR